MDLQMDIIHTEHTCADSCPAKNGTDLYHVTDLQHTMYMLGC